MYKNGGVVLDKKISIENLTVIYGKKSEEAYKMFKNGATNQQISEQTGAHIAVQDVSLDVYSKEILVIMGLSGSGKSTLLKTLNLLLRPNHGKIIVDGDNILEYNKKQLRLYRQKKTCMVFQNYGLLSHRTVLKNVEFGLEVEHINKDERRKIAEEMIKLVGLSGWENQYPEVLSGGMQQRVGLARAFANQPDILLMDEPFSALDPLIRDQMQIELLQLQTKLKKTIVFITHDINEAFILGDRIAIMKDGAIQQIGTPCEIMMDPQTEYVKEFIKNINKLQVFTCKEVMIPYDKNLVIDTSITLKEYTTLNEALIQLQNIHGNIIVTDNQNTIKGIINKTIIMDILVH